EFSHRQARAGGDRVECTGGQAGGGARRDAQHGQRSALSMPPRSEPVFLPAAVDALFDLVRHAEDGREGARGTAVRVVLPRDLRRGVEAERVARAREHAVAARVGVRAPVEERFVEVMRVDGGVEDEDEGGKKTLPLSSPAAWERAR